MCIHTSLYERRLVTNVSPSRDRVPVHSEGHQPRFSLVKGLCRLDEKLHGLSPNNDGDFFLSKQKTRRRSHDLSKALTKALI